MFMAIVGANLPGIHLAEWRSALLGISEGVSRGLNEWERDSLNVCVTVWAGSPNDRAKGENCWALAFLSLPPVHRNGKRPCPLHSPSVVMATVAVLWSRAGTTRLHPLFCLLNFFLFLTGWKYLWTHCYLLKLSLLHIGAIYMPYIVLWRSLSRELGIKACITSAGRVFIC